MNAIPHTGNSLNAALQRLASARDSAVHGPEKAVVPSYVVKEERPPPLLLPPARTVARHQNGLSQQEIRLLSAAGHFMQDFGKPIWIVTEAHDAEEREARKLFSQVKNHLVRIQNDFRKRLSRPVPAYWTEVLEGKCAVHQNLIGIVPLGRAAQETMDRLNSSRLFGENIETKLVYDMNRLVGYLAKEATSQAHYALGKGFRRVKGSHPLGAGGGDRVRLSEALEADMIREGRIEPRTKTYASRTLPKPVKAQKIILPAKPRLSVIPGCEQLPLFNTAREAKPVVRLHDFGGGFIPPVVAKEIRFLCTKKGGITAVARAAHISQPTLSNALNGLFPLGAWAAIRIREALLGPALRLAA